MSIQADTPSFRFYASGVYDDPDCHGEPEYLDHAVVAVGYYDNDRGDEDDDEDGGGGGGGGGGDDDRSGAGEGDTDASYWIIRNSWSPYWGDEGYIKISAVDNRCGVNSDWVYAVVDG